MVMMSSDAAVTQVVNIFACSLGCKPSLLLYAEALHLPKCSNRRGREASESAALNLHVQAQVRESMASLGVPDVEHTPAFWGNPADAPSRTATWAGLEFQVPVAGPMGLPPFRSGNDTSGPSAFERLKLNWTQHK